MFHAPARIAFLYAGICVLYLLREAAGPRVFSAAHASRAIARAWVPASLVALGLGAAILIATRYNPWTGSLWMIATFCAFVAFVGRARRDNDPRARVIRHRLGMIFLAAFSWWGALQGFGPAIGIALRGADTSTALYRGAAPGPFTPFFWGFLAIWAPAFLLGGYLVRRLRRH